MKANFGRNWIYPLQVILANCKKKKTIYTISKQFWEIHLFSMFFMNLLGKAFLLFYHFTFTLCLAKVVKLELEIWIIDLPFLLHLLSCINDVEHDALLDSIMPLNSNKCVWHNRILLRILIFLNRILQSYSCILFKAIALFNFYLQLTIYFMMFTLYIY